MSDEEKIPVMSENERMLLISDDEDDIVYNSFKKLIKENPEINLVYSRSNFDDLKKKLRRDYYIIFIDYDTLNMDVNELVNLIRNHLSALPLIIVMSYDESIFDETKIPHVSFLNKSVKKVVCYKHLLNMITLLKSNRSLKNISHLPGNYVINRVLQKKIDNDDDFTVMYIDIDKFKSYTDYYGINRASAIIKYLTDIVNDAVDKYGSVNDFIGHPGGDDFVIIFDNYESPALVGEELIRQFDANVRDFYDSKDVENNYITVLNRQGELEKFPIVSLSIITISNESKSYSNTNEIYEELGVAKKEAKQFSGSILLQS